jgi:RNase P subunit RPR2
MSCCRRRLPPARTRAAMCVNCRGPLQQQVKAEIEKRATDRPPGHYRESASLQCPRCQYVNRVPLVFTRS